MSNDIDRQKGGDPTKKLNKSGKTKKSSWVLTLVLVLMLLVGVGIMAYPTFSDWYNGLHQSRAIADYNQIVSNNDDARNEELWNEAVAYNEDLAKTGVNFQLSDFTDEDAAAAEGEASNNDAAPDAALAAAKERYEATLDVSGTGIMGYINIDKVNIHLPIYHDSTEGVLQVAVGHIAGTSLPVGGESSHCVLTGHTGLPSAKLFTDIDQLEEGDTFQIVVLDHTLTYKVSDIQVVLPYELDSLQIEQGKDLVTLVTCTPYGINTHRLLVTGTRIPTPETPEAKEQPKPSQNWQEQKRTVTIQEYLPIAAAAAAVLIIILLIIRSIRKKKRNTK